jgi:hypothetical protein
MGQWPDSVDTLKGDVIRDMHRPVQTAPTNPTAITGATAKMLGLAVAFTPRRTGRVLFVAKGNITCNTTAETTTVQLKYGTGTAPANDAADAGTQAGVDSTFTALTGVLTVPFADVALVDSLTIGTAYWFDYNAKTSNAGATGRVLDLNVTVLEV